MKILKIFAASLVSLVIASEAIATPFVWTIPQTTMDDGSTISGSFTYDAAVTPPLSAVNIVKTAPNSQIYNIVGASDAFYIRAAAAVGNSVPAIYININGIPANGGTLTKANGTIGIGLCNQTTGCTNVWSVGNYISNNASVTYTSQVGPFVTSVLPTSGITAGGTSITITGTDFTGATGVTIGGAACTNVVVVDATTITCTTPAGTAGAASVEVTTPNGSSAANTLFTYVVPAPTLTAISPTSGSTAGGTSITITGTDFTGATGVSIGGAACTNVVVVDATTITCTTPAGTAGTASVLVTTPGGTNAANTLFTYVVPTPAAIPTLSEWAMIFMASLMAMFGIRRMRRSK